MNWMRCEYTHSYVHKCWYWFHIMGKSQGLHYREPLKLHTWKGFITDERFSCASWRPRRVGYVAWDQSIIKCYNWMSTPNYLVWRCTAIPWHDVLDIYNKQVIVKLKILSLWLESCDVVIWQNLFRSLYRHRLLLTRCACGNKSYRVPVFIKTSTLFATKLQG